MWLLFSQYFTSSAKVVTLTQLKTTMWKHLAKPTVNVAVWYKIYGITWVMAKHIVKICNKLKHVIFTRMIFNKFCTKIIDKKRYLKLIATIYYCDCLVTFYFTKKRTHSDNKIIWRKRSISEAVNCMFSRWIAVYVSWYELQLLGSRFRISSTIQTISLSRHIYFPPFRFRKSRCFYFTTVNIWIIICIDQVRKHANGNTRLFKQNLRCVFFAISAIDHSYRIFFWVT